MEASDGLFPGRSHDMAMGQLPYGALCWLHSRQSKRTWQSRQPLLHAVRRRLHIDGLPVRHSQADLAGTGQSAHFRVVRMALRKKNRRSVASAANLRALRPVFLLAQGEQGEKEWALLV